MNGRVWSDADVRKLARLYPDQPTKRIAKALNATVFRVYAKARKLGLKKTDGYLHDPSSRCRLIRGTKIGQAYRFPKGHVPFNKGLRRPGYSVGRMKETQFKKGERSGVAAELWKPIGSVVADPEGYLRIKVRERAPGDAPGWNKNVWPLLSHCIWQMHHGPIPAKHVVVFKNRDRSNCAIENLELISMAENARRNRMWVTMPRELAEVIQLNGALKRQIRRLDGKEQGN